MRKHNWIRSKRHTKRTKADLQELLLGKLQTLLKENQPAGVTNNFGEVLIGKERSSTPRTWPNIDYQNVNPLGNGDGKTDELINIPFANHNIKFNEELGRYKRKKIQHSIGDELPAGVPKLAKVYMAAKRKLKVGDKMAGRHGNKGIAAKIVRQEDMPFPRRRNAGRYRTEPTGYRSRMNPRTDYEKKKIEKRNPILTGQRFRNRRTDHQGRYCPNSVILTYLTAKPANASTRKRPWVSST